MSTSENEEAAASSSNDQKDEKKRSEKPGDYLFSCICTHPNIVNVLKNVGTRLSKTCKSKNDDDDAQKQTVSSHFTGCKVKCCSSLQDADEIVDDKRPHKDSRREPSEPDNRTEKQIQVVSSPSEKHLFYFGPSNSHKHPHEFHRTPTPYPSSVSLDSTSVTLKDEENNSEGEGK